MPTNQSSPWGGGSLSAASVSRVPFKGSFRHASPELPKADDYLSSSSASPVWDKEDGNIWTSQDRAPSEPKQTASITVRRAVKQRHGSASEGRGNPTDDVAPESSSGCHGDPYVTGLANVQRSSQRMSKCTDCFPSPSVPHPCLQLQGAKLWKNTSSHNGTKQETRSTKRRPNIPRRSRSAKTPTKRRPTQITRAVRSSPNTQLMVRGGPPAVEAAASPRRSSSRGLDSSSCIKTQQQPDLRAGEDVAPGVAPGVAPCSAVALVGSVTSQISAIHLTREAQSSSASVTEEQLLDSEAVMQVDGVEEELPDELEHAGSDDDASECYSIIRSSSDASIPYLSSIEEPMVLAGEDDREERLALVHSLFPLFPPTLYFSTANEKVELLPVELRRLLKWKMSTVTPNIVKHTITRSHFKVTKKSYDWLGCWGHHMKSPGFKAIGEHQKLNHFPGTFQIGRKDRLWRNLSKMQLHFGRQEFNFLPRTFILPQDIKLLRKAWEESGSKQKWIVKPPASARGIGIQVIHKWSQLPRKRPLLVQKYIHKPYLIGGNKFDLRIYVYVTSYDPLRVYVFSDGLVRFASCKYSSSMKTLNNKFMHLTNYSVNKKNSEYQTNSDDKACQGHKWALKALWQHLGSKGINTTLIWEKIKDIVIKTIIASEPYVNNLLKMHVKTPYSCHELFGFDIMLDENLKPWILEVNISPSLHSNSALDVSVKGQMVRDLLNLAGFRIPSKEEVLSSCSSASSSTCSLSAGSKERSKADLSADEKVKRAFYLAQRYADPDFLSSVLDVLTPEDVRVLAESEDELSRRGEFQRVFPSQSSSRYLRFFECPRYLNILLDRWEQKYSSDRTKGIGFLRPLCQKGIHLGTRDPSHMWSKSTYLTKTEAHRPGGISPSRSSVVVSHRPRPHRDASDSDCSDPELASVSSLPVSRSPGSSLSSSGRASPHPSLTTARTQN